MTPGCWLRIHATSPEPLCASCNSSFIEQLPPSDDTQADDPRAFSAFNNLLNRDMPREQEHGVSGAIDPIGQLLGAVLGMRNLGPDATPPRMASPDSGSGSGPGPGSGLRGPTIQIRRDSDRQRSGSGMSFSFRSNSGSSIGGGLFGGFGRRDERERDRERERERERTEPPGLEEFLAAMFQGPPGGSNPNQGQTQGQGRGPPPLLQNMLMGLLGAGIGHPGVGVGSAGDGRWGDYALNQEALDQIITQLMESSHSAPVPVPEDMISNWPRTVLTPGNPLESHDCAVCKESFAFIPPDKGADSDPTKSTGDESQPQEALTLPCKHSFHVECIEPWVKVKGTCPVCRYELVPQNQRTQENNTPGGSGSGGGGGDSGSGNSRPGGTNRRPSEEGRMGSPMPPGAYALD
ncbi:Zf-rbx1 domain-containing protein [Ceratobasidium theobromae]|uniref:Zf-rbx1 domain-containing protein n=1 Tax=Ceratobasidium theobromae TaxID=1582974 RepID=A0A5N5QAY3_9AGAM|nr:Zf-rbx1 domain-containing protein [Ceratobasidium theobromae]